MSGPPGEQQKQQEPPRAPIPPEPLAVSPLASPTGLVGKVGGNQDTPTLLTENVQKAPQVQSQQPKQQQQQPQTQTQQQQPSVAVNNNSTTGGPLSNLTNGLMALGRILLGSVTGGELSQNQTRNTTDPIRGNFRFYVSHPYRIQISRILSTFNFITLT